MMMTYGQAYEKLPSAGDQRLSDLEILLIGYDYKEEQTYKITLEQFIKMIKSKRTK